MFTNIRVTIDMDDVSTLPNKLISGFTDEMLMKTAGYQGLPGELSLSQQNSQEPKKSINSLNTSLVLCGSLEIAFLPENLQ